MTIVHKRSSVAGKVPAVANLAAGELALNTTDGKIYLKKTTGGVDTVVDFINTVDGTNAIGDLIYSAYPLPAPTYLEADGQTYLRSAYPELSSVIGAVNSDHVATQGGGAGSVAITSVTYGNGKFWATTGYSSGVYILYSSVDGLSWTQAASGVRGSALAVNGNTMVCVGQLDSNLSRISTFQYSLNGGTTWTSVTGTFGTTAGQDYSWRVTYANGLFVIIGSSATYAGYKIATSPDGVTWTRRYTAFTGSLQQVMWTGANFLISTSSADTVLTSPDGITWTTRSITGAASITRATGCTKQGVVLQIDYSNYVFRSTDHGVTWANLGLMKGFTVDIFVGNNLPIHYVDDVSPRFVLPCSTNGDKLYYLISDDNGASFRQMNTDLAVPYNHSIGNQGSNNFVFPGAAAGTTYRMARPYDMATLFAVPKPPANSLPGITTKLYVRAK